MLAVLSRISLCHSLLEFERTRGESSMKALDYRAGSRRDFARHLHGTARCNIEIPCIYYQLHCLIFTTSSIESAIFPESNQTSLDISPGIKRTKTR